MMMMMKGFDSWATLVRPKCQKIPFNGEAQPIIDLYKGLNGKILVKLGPQSYNGSTHLIIIISWHSGRALAEEKHLHHHLINSSFITAQLALQALN